MSSLGTCMSVSLLLLFVFAGMLRADGTFQSVNVNELSLSYADNGEGRESIRHSICVAPNHFEENYQAATAA